MAGRIARVKLHWIADFRLPIGKPESGVIYGVFVNSDQGLISFWNREWMAGIRPMVMRVEPVSPPMASRARGAWASASSPIPKLRGSRLGVQGLKVIVPK